ncbi:MAG: PQQ-dependent sugar dehydrogenase [Phycisphaerales bacterium]
MRLNTLVIGAAAALTAATALAQPFQAERVLTGFIRPVAVVAPPDGSGRYFVVEQRIGSTGTLRVVHPGHILEPNPFATFTVATSSEQGLLGLAFHPDFANNRRLFVNYTRPDGDTVVQELRADPADPDIAEAGSAKTILIVDQPDSNHNCGWLTFGPDGYLYIGFGDGGSGNDPWGPIGNAQNLETLLGSMIRIDVDGDDFPADPDRNYAIPADNPFVDGDPLTADEIWAYGLRNPWRNDFDPMTGDLYIADVGQGQREEVDYQPASSTGGENYGWRKWEGTRLNFSGDPDPGPVVFPVTEYNHSSPDFGCAITGGVVVRSCDLADLYGEFLYADYCSNRFYTVHNTVNGWITEEITSQITPDVGSLSNVSAFGRDADGNVYICTLGGSIYHLTSDRNGLADVDHSGVLNLDDVNTFAAAFVSGAPAADINQDGAFNLDDVNLFAAAFVAGGCP